jgi:hypothetical protein
VDQSEPDTTVPAAPKDWISLQFLAIRCENAVAGEPKFLRGENVEDRGGGNSPCIQALSEWAEPLVKPNSSYSSVQIRSEWVYTYAGCHGQACVRTYRR